MRRSTGLGRAASDYKLDIRHRDDTEVIAAALDFMIRNRAISGALADRARNVIRECVEKLLMRKRLTDEQKQEIRQRWKAYE